MAAANVSSAECLTNSQILEDVGSLQSFSVKNKKENFEIDLAVKCRGCFVEDPEMHYLYTVFDQKLSLADILMQATSFECNEEDGFPPYLCTKCTTCLIDFFNFKIQFQKTDLYIRTLLGKTPSALESVTVKEELREYDSSSSEHDPFQVVNDEEDEEASVESELPEIHSEIQLEIANYCDLCQIEFEDAGECETHMARDHGQNPFEKFSLFREMVLENEKAIAKAKRNMKMMRADLENEKLQDMPGKLCRICRRKFPDEEFKEHWELHKTHICDQCGYKCVKTSDLNIHKQALHGNERNFVCSICGKSFKTKPMLKRHNVVHTNPRTYCCDICGQRFNHDGTLKTHVKLKHVRKRDFVCPVCGLAFPMKSTLDKHIFRHNKDRPATHCCEICKRWFRDKSSLNRHHLVKHSDEFERPSCPHCGKSYCSKTKLKMHIERHHGPAPYQRKRRQTRDISLTNVKEEWLSHEETSSGGEESSDDGVRKEEVEEEDEGAVYMMHHSDSLTADNIVHYESSEGDSNAT